MTNDEKILRSLAFDYIEAAHEPRNEERRRLHIASNDLHMIRPVVMIDELPWPQLNFDGSLTCLCEDKELRGVEWFFRSQLYRWRNMPADMILRPFLPVGKRVRSTGIGIEAQETTLASGQATNIISHTYKDLLEEEEALELIHPAVLEYDRAGTMAEWTKLGTVVGDILPLRLCGIGGCHVASWDDISRYRGVTPVLMDLIDRPEYSHKIIEKITQCKVAELEQREALGLLDTEPDTLHCTPTLTEDLPRPEDGVVTRKHVWGRGTAQIFGSVSKEMHDEFDIEYMKRTVGTCGLVYYGCCEPLDRKIDIVEKLPNLRKVSITPWADINVAAEVIGGRYVISNKPNPAAVAVPQLNKAALEQEIGGILDACKRNGARGLDIVLKDISTTCDRPGNLFEWEQTVMAMVESW